MHDRRSREVPKIFADEDTHPTESGRVERQSNAIAGGKIALLVEQAVGGQINLAMDVDQSATLGIKGRIVEAVPRRLLDKAGHHGRRAGRREQFLDLGRVAFDRHVGNHVAQEIAGQRQLGKDDQVGVGLPRCLDPIQVQLEVLARGPPASGEI